MNDWPTDSYYYRPHCNNYIAHWVSLCTPPPTTTTTTKQKRKEHLCLHPPFFFSVFSNLLSDLQLYGMCEWGRGRWWCGQPSLPQESNCWTLFPFSCTHTPLRLWSLSPGAQEFSDLREARLRVDSCSPPPAGLGPRVGKKASRVGP